MNQKQLLLFLEDLRIRPKKHLSQNFLIDSNLIEKVLRVADIQPQEKVLEIGPGAGALTKALLNRQAHVYAVEKDPILVKALERLQSSDRTLHIYTEDIRRFPIESLGVSPLRVVANLPYHIASSLIFSLCRHPNPFTTLTLFVQQELADRLMAPPHSKLFGVLSLFFQLHTEVTSSFPVPPSCFYPQPKVASRVLHLKPIAPQQKIQRNFLD